MVTEITVLDIHANSIDFNIGYIVEVEPIENQDCFVESRDELNTQLIKPLVWSVIRGVVGKLDESGINSIHKEDLQTEINNTLSNGNISFNGKKLTHCRLKISMFTITRRN